MKKSTAVVPFFPVTVRKATTADFERLEREKRGALRPALITGRWDWSPKNKAKLVAGSDE